ncbi:MAG: hypothetical protein H6707_18240 [Deltaproteobacteria bacterium]|nr:hypothetical protein [Deltaproteobacteria bacterium]
MAVVALATGLGCGDFGGVEPPPNLGPPLLALVYQGTSAERPLTELRLHPSSTDYRAAKNRLSQPLMPDASVDISDIAPGYYYLTVMRKRLSLPESDMLALTTAEPIALVSGRYRVWVFDESFRVFDPVKNPQD